MNLDLLPVCKGMSGEYSNKKSRTRKLLVVAGVLLDLTVLTSTKFATDNGLPNLAHSINRKHVQKHVSLDYIEVGLDCVFIVCSLLELTGNTNANQFSPAPSLTHSLSLYIFL